MAEDDPRRPADSGAPTVEGATQPFTPAGEGIDETLAAWAPLIGPGTAPDSTLRAPPGEDEPSRALLVRRLAVGRGDGGDQDLDYRIEREIGHGGMGTVVAATQHSMGRTVALKLLRETPSGAAGHRDRFLDEAAVTGVLEHPNIVPVHDLGISEQGELFYSMKLVRGVPWDKRLEEHDLERNLEILLRVCDGVAFAHSRDVIHRDLKPHNVMLGEFGEVLIVDWGLALEIAPGRRPENPVQGGTANYMAPEMARGESDLLGPCSDVYLLGAILYQIVSGRPPHRGATSLECIASAAFNEVEPPEGGGELGAIAMKALATDPARRHPSVVAFQDALREYQSHAQSRRLAVQAREDLAAAAGADDYTPYNRALHGFEQALLLWSDNRDAAAGIRDARLAYARRAREREDLDLAASMLQFEELADCELAQQVRAAHAERDARQRRLRLLTRAAAVLAATLLISLTTGVVLVWQQKNRAVVAERQAAEQRDLALQTLSTLVFEVDEELAHRPAMQDLRETLLDEAIVGLEQVLASGDDQAAVDRARATAEQSTALILHTARRREDAEQHQQRAVAVFEALLAEDPGDPRARLELARAHRVLGNITFAQRVGDMGRTREHLDDALRLLQPLLDERGEDAEIVLEGMKIHVDRGDLAYQTERYEEAAGHYQGAVDLGRRALDLPGASEAEVLRSLHHPLTQLGECAWVARDWDTARARYRAVEANAVRLLEVVPNDLQGRRFLGLTRANLAWVDADQGRTEVALEGFRSSRAYQQELVLADSTNGSLQRDLLVTTWRLGDLLLRDLERPAEAREAYLAASATAELLLGLNPENAESRRDLAVLVQRIGDLDLEEGRVDAALAAYQRSLELAVANVEAAPDNLISHTDVVVATYKCGQAELEAGRAERARERFTEALAILQRERDAGRLTEESRFHAWIEVLESEIGALP